MSRPRGRKYPRRTNFREVRKRYLIVCEGEGTEPWYFKNFRHKFRLPIQVKIFGEGKNTISLVNRAIEIIKTDSWKYDQAWCVFDRDNFPKRDFNEAIYVAQKSGIKVAYSNQAFELWFILHFQYLDVPQSRRRLCEILEKNIGKRYSKSNPNFFELLVPQIEPAIKHAERLLQSYRPQHPETDNPSTTVHLLVRELLSNKNP